MKAQLTAKYLEFLSKKNKNQNAGFTLIELLVVIIIIGILSAIALPSFLNQAAKARGAEAKTNVGAMNRAQQAYFLENQKFVAGKTVTSDLGLSMDASTDNFNYSAAAIKGKELTEAVANFGNAKEDKNDIKSYSGGIFYAENATTTILCEAKDPGKDAEAPSDTTNDGCGKNGKLIN